MFTWYNKGVGGNKMILRFQYDDGGHSIYARRAVGDCAVRAMSIVTGADYPEILAKVKKEGEKERGNWTQSDGVSYTRLSAVRNIMRGYGWTFVDMRKNPKRFMDWKASRGTFLVWCPYHFTAVVDGTIRDMFDPSNGGTEIVKGYWYKKRE